MAYLVTFHWGWMLGAALIGLGMGWISVVQRGGLSTVAFRRSLAAIAVLLAISLAHLLPGRFGYGLDLGLVMFGAYLVGCVVGAWLRHLVVSRPSAAN